MNPRPKKLGQYLLGAFIFFVILSIVGLVYWVYNIALTMGQSESPSPTQFFITALFSILVLGSIVAQIIVNSLQWTVSREQGEILQETFNRTARTDRAYFALHPTAAVRVEFFPWPIPGETKPGFCVVHVTFVNGGKTPAWEFFSRGDAYFNDPDKVENKYFQWPTADDFPNPSMVPPNFEKPMQIKYLGDISDARRERILRGEKALFVDGEIRYRDFDGKLHAMRYGVTIVWFDGSPSKGRERYQEHYEPEDNGQNPN